MDTNNDIYRRMHFAVMAVESGNRLINSHDELHNESIEWASDDIGETLL